MTQEQFKKAINDRESHIKNLRKEIAELTETYLNEHTKFEIGEKVLLVETNWNGVVKEQIAFISKMWTTDGKINYNFHKAKKDGTPSQMKLYTYGRHEVKKLNTEPEAQASVATEADSNSKADNQPI